MAGSDSFDEKGSAGFIGLSPGSQKRCGCCTIKAGFTPSAGASRRRRGSVAADVRKGRRGG